MTGDVFQDIIKTREIGKIGLMRVLDRVNRYLAFKLKAVEFRLQSWRRAREISRAYDARPAGGRARIPIRIPVRINFGAVAPYAIRTAKVSGIAVAAFVLVFGAIKVIPLISVPTAAKTPLDERRVDDADAAPPPVQVQEVPEGAVVPEAAVLPEGYANNAAATPNTDDRSMSDAAQQPARPAATPPSRSDRSLADIFRAGIPRGVSERLIFADKAAKVLYLFKSAPGGWEVERAYPMATGENEGRKVVEGDKKTPQGVYFIMGRKHNSELTNLYGPAAFILDYPNEEDRRERRTGHGIWIHGSERGGIPPLFTQGCLAVSNPDILDLASVIRNGIGTPVVIVSGTEDGRAHLASVDFNRLKARGEEIARRHSEKQAEFEALVMSWKAAWESRDIDAYSEFYSTATFADGVQKWDAFKERKKGLFSRYSAIYVDLSDIALTELTDNSATVKFYQVYNTNMNNRMENAKRLIFKKEQDSWKIHREIPFSKEELLL